MKTTECFLSYPAQRRVTRTLSVLFCLDAVTSDVEMEASGSSAQTDRSKRCQNLDFFLNVCCTVFTILFRLNKAHRNFQR